MHSPCSFIKREYEGQQHILKLSEFQESASDWTVKTASQCMTGGAFEIVIHSALAADRTIVGL